MKVVTRDNHGAPTDNKKVKVAAPVPSNEGRDQEMLKEVEIPKEIQNMSQHLFLLMKVVTIPLFVKGGLH